MTVINDLPFYYSTLNSIGSWLAENDSKHALFIIYIFAMFIQAIQFSNAGLNGGLFTY